MREQKSQRPDKSGYFWFYPGQMEQEGTEAEQSPGPMADAVLQFGIDLGQGQTQFRQQKNRIVAEAVLTPGSLDDPAGDGPLGLIGPSLIDQDRDADELSLEILFRDVRDQAEKFFYIPFIVGLGSSEPGRDYPRGSLQGVHLQAGVVGQGRQPGMVGRQPGLLQGILEICPAPLLGAG